MIPLEPLYRYAHISAATDVGMAQGISEKVLIRPLPTMALFIIRASTRPKMNSSPTEITVKNNVTKIVPDILGSLNIVLKLPRPMKLDSMNDLSSPDAIIIMSSLSVSSSS